MATSDRWVPRGAPLGALILVLAVLTGCAGGESSQEPIVINVREAEPGTEGPDDESEAEGPSDAESEADGQGSGAGFDGGPVRRPLAEARAIEPPDTFWAIEETTYDLVAVSTSTGDVTIRIGGWGQEAAEGELGQALTSVEHASSGLLWVDDCCEPAFGTSYGFEGDGPIDVPDDAVQQRSGLNPEVSADGSRVAVAAAPGSVSVTDTAGGGEAISTDGVVDAAVGADGEQRDPLAWLSDDVLAVGSIEENTTMVIPVNVSGPEPILAGSPIEIEGLVASADVNSEGYLVVAVRDTAEATSTAGRVIDPDTGEVTAGFALPAETMQIDYDETGTYLLVSTRNGDVSWQGRGASGVLGAGHLGASW